MTTSAFLDLTNHVIASFDLPTARIACVAHPLGGITEDDVRERARGMVEEIIKLFSTTP